MNAGLLLNFSVLFLSFGYDAPTGPLPIRQISFSPDGKWLVATGGTVKPRGGEGVAKVWQTATWKIQETWTDGFTDYVQQQHFISNDVIATFSNKMLRDAGRGDSPRDGITVRYWNIPQKKELPPFHLKERAIQARSIGYYPPKSLICFSKNFNVLATYTIPDVVEKARLKEERKGIALLRFSPDGKRILTCFRDAVAPDVCLYDAANGERAAVHKLDASNEFSTPTEVRTARFSPNGKTLALTTESPGKIYLLKADLSAALWVFDAPILNDCIEFTPDSEHVAIKKDRNTVQIYEIKSKELARTFDKNPEGVNGWCFSPDGALIGIACGGHPNGNSTSPGRVRVFEVKTGKLVAELD